MRSTEENPVIKAELENDDTAFVISEPTHAANEPVEDTVLKTAMEYFREELLPFLGVTGAVRAVMPTEEVDVSLTRKYEDYNFLMAGSDIPDLGAMEEAELKKWIAHLEFESRNRGKSGLKKFRCYEAFYSERHDIPVITYVLYSGNVKNPMTEYTEGLNTYRIKPIIMTGKNADEIIAGLRGKPDLTKKDLVPLMLTPLMSGGMSIKERVAASFEILFQNGTVLAAEEEKKMEAVLYAMADKFLGEEELQELKEVVKMTKLGRILREDGRAEGRAEGEARFAALAKLTEKLLAFGRTDDLLRATKDETFFCELCRELKIQ